MYDPRELEILDRALRTLAAGFDGLPAHDAGLDTAAIDEVLQQVAVRMRDNYPYFHPRYAGQMLKPPHPIARIAYMLSLWINPNNHALDGGIASSAMEKEAVALLANMLGYDDPLGHLTGGGTMANLEALWVAGRQHPGKKIVASEQAHYTHGRITEVLQLPFESVPTDSRARMDLEALASMIEAGDVGTVVATLGTTGVGSVDPLHEILPLARQHGVRVHVDAAYGGYFRLADGLDDYVRQAYDATGEADSIVIDPHKHGLQPYGCGCILFRDPSVGSLYRHDSPYTYFSSAELHLGEISLECSRAGAAAVGLWATLKLLPMERGGEFAGMMTRCLDAARRLYAFVDDSEYYRPLFYPEIDIVIYAPVGTDAASVSARSNEIFEIAAKKELHLAVIELPMALAAAHWPDLEANRDTVACVRSCMMRPEQVDWIDDIGGVLEDAARAASS